MTDWQDAARKSGSGCLKRHDFGGRRRGSSGWGGERFFRLLLASNKRLVIGPVKRSSTALEIFGRKRHKDYRARD